MKFLRNNLAYIVLGLIALVLIFVTISLQVAILSTGETQNNRGILYTLRQQLAELIQPAADTPVTTTSATVGQPTATAVILPTNTPNVIVIQPSPLPATPTTGVSVPTATAAAATLATGTAIQVPGISNASALATRLAAPTATTANGIAVATPAPTATVLPPAPNTPTNAPADTPSAADFRIGYVTDNPDCVAVTDVMKVVLEREFKLRIATVPFPDAASLFAKLATKTTAEQVDFSFCYMDPSDRSYLQQYFGFMIFIGSGYRQLDNQKYIIMSNAAVKSPIERGNPCLYRFLTNLNLTDVDLGSGDAETWYQTHTDLIATWTRCE